MLQELTIGERPASSVQLVWQTRGSPLVHVHLSLLADHVREAAPDTPNGSHGIHDLLLAVNVGVENTENVLKLLASHERLQAPAMMSDDVSMRNERTQ